MNLDTSRELAVLATDLHKSFGNGKVTTPVLNGISLAVYRSELTLIIGPSGSGKTTLLSILGGLLHPDTGAVRALDRELTAMAPRAMEKFRLDSCGFVFQGFNLFASLTAIQQILLMLHYTGTDDQTAAVRAERALAEVGLAGQKNLYPAEMSGGETAGGHCPGDGQKPAPAVCRRTHQRAGPGKRLEHYQSAATDGPTASDGGGSGIA